MAEPDLAAAFQKPKVMQAIMEAQQDPMAMLKYQDDPGRQDGALKKNMYWQCFVCLTWSARLSMAHLLSRR